jgi:hypothetical protein
MSTRVGVAARAGTPIATVATVTSEPTTKRRSALGWG